MPAKKAETKRKPGRPRLSEKKTEKKRDKPGRPPLYGETETPKGCRHCGSEHTKTYGKRKAGAGTNARLVRYRECIDCGRRYTSNEFIS